MNKEDIVDWFTAKKEHIPIKEGKTKKEALDDFKEEHKEDTQKAKQDTEKKKGAEDLYNSEPIGYDSQDDFSQLKSNLEKLQAQKVVDFVRSVKEGKPIAKSVVVGAINDRERKRIEELTGEKLNATKHVLNTNEVVHILKRHGENGQADKSMANVQDFTKIEDTLHNFDSLNFAFDEKGNNVISLGYLNKEGRHAKMLEYKKRIDDKTFFVAEALTDTKKGELIIISAYQSKKE